MARKKNATVEENNAEVAASVDFDNPDDVTPIEDDGVVVTDGPDSEVEEQTAAEPEVVKQPTMDDPAWTPWVLSQFEATELEEGLPKVDGLRRVVRKLIGPILKGKAKTRQTPTIDNEQRATVEYTVRVLNKNQLASYEEPYVVEFTDVADAYVGNIKGLEYARFPTAMAATRAEARALRKVLNLGVVASDETSDQPLEEAGFTGRITESQITKIDIKCSQLNIDVLKFINQGKAKFRTIEDVSNVVAVKMYGLINEYQQQVKPIPDAIKGYKPNWRGDL